LKSHYKNQYSPNTFIILIENVSIFSFLLSERSFQLKFLISADFAQKSNQEKHSKSCLLSAGEPPTSFAAQKSILVEVGILIVLLLRSPCKNMEPHLPSFW
jgi:hypothetical protein